MGYDLYASMGTADFYTEHGVKVILLTRASSLDSVDSQPAKNWNEYKQSGPDSSDAAAVK